MRNKIILFAAVLFFLIITTSCKASFENNNINQKEQYENLNIIPFKERKFIYRNGLSVENKQETINKDDKLIDKRYPQITGLINKEVEKKINEDIENLVNIRLNEVENTIKIIYTDPKIESISTSAYINYNCNNVMFIEYSSYITYITGAVSESYYFTKSQGYDLNTGNYITLKDLFKQDVDYNKILNDYIYMEIISSNYDDPDSLFMNKPFQGTHENQSFSFDENRLLIIMDEKNEEFNNNGYPITIYISLKDIGKYLAIFDRYFDEGNNIFENSKRIKKLMPNHTYFNINNGIMDYEEYYNIYIETGEFVGLYNIEIKKMLDSMVSHNLDVEGFRERAKAYVTSHPAKYYGHLGHSVDVMMNEGGYFSLYAYSYKNELDIIEGYHKYINFNFNNNKIMKLKDLFVDGFNYNSVIVKLLKTNPNYYFSEGTFADDEEILVAESDFNFSQDAVLVILYQPGVYVREQHLWIEFKDIGYENISIFQ